MNNVNELHLTNRAIALLIAAWLIVNYRERIRVAMQRIVNPAGKFNPQSDEILRATGS